MIRVRKLNTWIRIHPLAAAAVAAAVAAIFATHHDLGHAISPRYRHKNNKLLAYDRM